MLNPPGEPTPENLQKLWDLCRSFIIDQRVSCPEATCEDRVYEHAPELVDGIGKIVGFHRYDKP